MFTDTADCLGGHSGLHVSFCYITTPSQTPIFCIVSRVDKRYLITIHRLTACLPSEISLAPISWPPSCDLITRKRRHSIRRLHRHRCKKTILRFFYSCHVFTSLKFFYFINVFLFRKRSLKISPKSSRSTSEATETN